MAPGLGGGVSDESLTGRRTDQFNRRCTPIAHDTPVDCECRHICGIAVDKQSFTQLLAHDS